MHRKARLVVHISTSANHQGRTELQLNADDDTLRDCDKSRGVNVGVIREVSLSVVRGFHIFGVQSGNTDRVC